MIDESKNPLGRCFYLVLDGQIRSEEVHTIQARHDGHTDYILTIDGKDVWRTCAGLYYTREEAENAPRPAQQDGETKKPDSHGVIRLGTKSLTDTDRAVAFQAALHLMSHFGLDGGKDAAAIGEAVTLAFTNGIAFERDTTPGQRDEIKKRMRPVVDYLFHGGPEPASHGTRPAHTMPVTGEA